MSWTTVLPSFSSGAEHTYLSNAYKTGIYEPRIRDEQLQPVEVASSSLVSRSKHLLLNVTGVTLWGRFGVVQDL